MDCSLRLHAGKDQLQERLLPLKAIFALCRTKERCRKLTWSGGAEIVFFVTLQQHYIVNCPMNTITINLL